MLKEGYSPIKFSCLAINALKKHNLITFLHKNKQEKYGGWDFSSQFHHFYNHKLRDMRESCMILKNLIIYCCPRWTTQYCDLIFFVSWMNLFNDFFGKSSLWQIKRIMCFIYMICFHFKRGAYAHHAPP